MNTVAHISLLSQAITGLQPPIGQAMERVQKQPTTSPREGVECRGDGSQGFIPLLEEPEEDIEQGEIVEAQGDISRAPIHEIGFLLCQQVEEEQPMVSNRQPPCRVTEGTQLQRNCRQNDRSAWQLNANCDC